DVASPRELHPVFHGAFDWHSAVHGHWCVVRALRLSGDEAFTAEAWPVLVRRLAPEALAGEHRYLASPDRTGFERPYGLAWLLQLAAELREWREPGLAAAAEAFEPLSTLASERLSAWLTRLPYAVRSGEHSQSAFALGLALDWARVAGAREFGATIERESLRLYGGDREAPLGVEPSGNDFLSPALGEADLMRRVLTRPDFAAWLNRYWPAWESGADFVLQPVTSPDLADGKLSHLAGLNLSRAWMLEGIVSALDPASAGAGALTRSAAAHRAAGLAAVTDGPYAATHWLGSFAMYLVTQRGIAGPST
ncbi:MAG: DUF2891 family protein, partial [Candidatus Eisenbacteria bacterium]